MVLQPYYYTICITVLILSTPTLCSHTVFPAGLSTIICYSETYQPIYLKSEERECVYNTKLETAFINHIGSDPRLMPNDIV